MRTFNECKFICRDDCIYSCSLYLSLSFDTFLWPNGWDLVPNQWFHTSLSLPCIRSGFYRKYFGSLFAGSFRRLLDHHHHHRRRCLHRQIEINYECFIMSVMIMLHFWDKEINKVCVIFGGFSLSILPADLPNNEQHTGKIIMLLNVLQIYILKMISWMNMNHQ